MKALALTTQGFVTEQAALPKCDRQTVLVRTLSCGICEGDLFDYRSCVKNGEIIENKYPGHEGTGIVEDVGKSVTGFQKGDLVTANGCGFGGNFSEYFLADARDLAKLPGGVDVSITHGEPVSCCVNGMRRARIGLRSRVAVIGCGYMGMICLKLALLQGAREVVAIDPIDWRIRLAKEFGAVQIYTPEQVDPNQIGEFDVVIEATGLPQPLNMAVELVKQHGKILVFGYHQSEGGVRHLDMRLLNFKAVDLINAHSRRNDEKMDALAESVELMGDGRLDVGKLVTPYPAEQINIAMEDLLARKEGLFKAAIVYR